MLKIRLQRVGRKHEPTFRVVLTDSRNSTKSGKFLEVLGSYDPRHKDKMILNRGRIIHWISYGAHPTDSMHNMLVRKGIIAGKKIHVSRMKKIAAKTEPTIAAASKEKGEEEKSSEA